MFRKTVATFLICSLMSATSVFAEGEASSSVSTSSGNAKVINEILDSSITRRLVSRMGEPGFYASRFLKLRSTVNKPACTYSEHTAKIATITSIVGDLTAHAFDYFQGKKLEKEFADKLEKIENYEKELKASGKKILEYQAGSPDIQLDALKLLKAQAELELKRAEMVSVVAYVVLGLNVTSKILAMIEAGVEAASTGTIAAKTLACRNAQKAKEGAAEAATVKTSKLSNEPVSWYLVPFKYLMGTDLYKGYRSYSKGLDKEKFIKEQKAAGNTDANIDQVALHAGYAEEMLVDVIFDVYKKWTNGNRNVTEEINNFNKNGKELNGILKFLKQTRLDRIGIRFAVRTLIKANLIQIDGFASSGVGRAILFAHNVYIVHKTISDNKAQVDYAKHKISLIDKAIKDFESKVTWMPLFNKFLDSILPAAAVASQPPTGYLFPNPPCAVEILPTCDLKNYDLMNANIREYVTALPKDAQTAQHNVLTNNYALKAALNLATGKVSYENIDVKKLEDEAKVLESMASKLEKELSSKDKNFAANYEPQLARMNSEMIFTESMLASYKSALPEYNNTLESSLGISKVTSEKEIPAPVSDIETVTSEVTSENVTPPPSGEKMPEAQYNFEVETISKKESNLFEIITNRYIQIYKRNDLVE